MVGKIECYGVICDKEVVGFGAFGLYCVSYVGENWLVRKLQKESKSTKGGHYVVTFVPSSQKSHAQLLDCSTPLELCHVSH